MPKFYGTVGFGETVEKRPGVYEDVITERKFYGDIIRDSRSLQQGDKVISDISIGNRFSIVADSYASEHIYAMRYLEWSGVKWIINDVEVHRPRLIIGIGGVYNGPTPEAA